MVGDIQVYLQNAGITGGAADQAVLSKIQQQLDIEAIAAGCRDNLLMISIASCPASFPLWWLTLRRSQTTSQP